MALFQKTVEHKYLKQLDSELINAKYLEFKTYFGNPDKQGTEYKFHASGGLKGNCKI